MRKSEEFDIMLGMVECPSPLAISEIAVKGGWALDLACAIDKRQPGFVGAYLRSSPRRRQVINAILSHRWAAANDEPNDNFAMAAHQSLTRRETDVISAHLGNCPSGFLSLLSKLGEHALPRDFYSRLHRICADPAGRTSVTALRHLNRISTDMLEIVEALPTDWRRAGLVEKLESAREARDFLRTMRFVMQHCPAATETALTASIKRLCREGSVADFVSVRLHRCHFPDGPLPDGSDLHFVRDGQELAALGLRMRNCLTEQIMEILRGHAAIYVVRHLRQDVIIKLERSSRHDDWAFDDVYIKGNQRVQDDLRRAVIDILVRNGFDPERREQLISADETIIEHFLWRARRYRRR